MISNAFIPSVYSAFTQSLEATTLHLSPSSNYLKSTLSFSYVGDDSTAATLLHAGWHRPQFGPAREGAAGQPFAFKYYEKFFLLISDASNIDGLLLKVGPTCSSMHPKCYRLHSSGTAPPCVMNDPNRVPGEPDTISCRFIFPIPLDPSV